MECEAERRAVDRVDSQSRGAPPPAARHRLAEHRDVRVVAAEDPLVERLLRRPDEAAASRASCRRSKAAFHGSSVAEARPSSAVVQASTLVGDERRAGSPTSRTARSRIGADPTDSSDERFRKRLLVGIALIILPAGLSSRAAGPRRGEGKGGRRDLAARGVGSPERVTRATESCARTEASPFPRVVDGDPATNRLSMRVLGISKTQTARRLANPCDSGLTGVAAIRAPHVTFPLRSAAPSATRASRRTVSDSPGPGDRGRRREALGDKSWRRPDLHRIRSRTRRTSRGSRLGGRSWDRTPSLGRRPTRRTR